MKKISVALVILAASVLPVKASDLCTEMSVVTEAIMTLRQREIAPLEIVNFILDEVPDAREIANFDKVVNTLVSAAYSRPLKVSNVEKGEEVDLFMKITKVACPIIAKELGAKTF